MRIALAVGAVTALLQPLSGDLLAKFVFRTQPAKFAAMEAHFETGPNAAMNIGGVADERTREVRHAIKIPALLSILADHRPSTVVKGLNDIPRDLWPNVALTHLCFDVMVGCGTLLMALGAWFLIRWRRKRAAVFESRAFVRTIAFAGPLGFVALEAGWIVTEAGRQPWVIQGYLKTADAMTPFGDVRPFMFGFVALYLLLAIMVIVLLRYIARDRSAPAPTQPTDY
jgi:cytochrome d ubiquinol oxidase subunit I